MSTYAFFGGSFNPPTKAHIGLAEQAIKEFNIDQFFFVPVGNFFPKEGLIEEEKRYEMLSLICKQKEKMKVSSMELNRTESLKAIDVFREIKKKYPKDTLYYIMGADNFGQLTQWKDSKELIENYQFILLNRKGNDIKKIIEKSPMLQKNRAHFQVLSGAHNFSISSTEIRENIQKGNWKQVEEDLEPSIVSYIKEKKLYQNTID